MRKGLAERPPTTDAELMREECDLLMLNIESDRTPHLLHIANTTPNY